MNDKERDILEDLFKRPVWHAANMPAPQVITIPPGAVTGVVYFNGNVPDHTTFNPGPSLKITLMPQPENVVVDVKDAVPAYHFLPYNRRLLHGDNRKVSAGSLFSVETASLCIAGLHASRRLVEAVQFAPSPILSKVKVWGKFQEEESKIVGTVRECLWIKDFDLPLRFIADEIAHERLAKVKSVPGWVVEGLTLKTEHYQALRLGKDTDRIESAIYDFRRDNSHDWHQLQGNIDFDFKEYMSLLSTLSFCAVMNYGNPYVSTKPSLDDVNDRLMAHLEDVPYIK